MLAPQTTYQYWQYFLALDADLETISRYVEFNPANYNTFSIEFVRLILAAGSEIDVVAKLLCELIDPTKPCKNINDYRSIILSKYPLFYLTPITIPRYELQLNPWGVWDGGVNPLNPGWWTAYNAVKHERSSNFD